MGRRTWREGSNVCLQAIRLPPNPHLTHSIPSHSPASPHLFTLTSQPPPVHTHQPAPSCSHSPASPLLFTLTSQPPPVHTHQSAPTCSHSPASPHLFPLTSQPPPAHTHQPAYAQSTPPSTLAAVRFQASILHATGTISFILNSLRYASILNALVPWQ